MTNDKQGLLMRGYLIRYSYVDDEGKIEHGIRRVTNTKELGELVTTLADDAGGFSTNFAMSIHEEVN